MHDVMLPRPMPQALALPLRRTDLPADEVHVWCAWVDAWNRPPLRAYYQSLLGVDETARLNRLALERVKSEFLVTRALCRSVLSLYADVAPAHWRFRKNGFGRPEVDSGGAAPPLRFNLSNTRELVVCAVTRSADVGVDVESLSRQADLDEIARHYFSLEERLALDALPLAARNRRFFEHWTLKEAYAKGTGVGLTLGLSQLSFALAEGTIRATFDTRIDDRANEWQFELHELGGTHLLALAVRYGSAARLAVRIREAPPPGPEVAKVK
ncbi:4'-phosphopantetheinyl transferase superfamily protein [Paraburkholderia jirisanensis]